MIYTDRLGRVISTGSPVDDATAIDITDDDIFSDFSDTRKLCYFYLEDGTFYPAMDLNTIALLEAKQAEIDKLNEIIDTLILSSLEGNDV